jgi:hypothetical protein
MRRMKDIRDVYLLSDSWRDSWGYVERFKEILWRRLWR